MARIDLRGEQLTAARLRAALPRGGADVEAVLPWCARSCEAVAERGAEAALELRGDRSTACDPRPSGCPTPSWTPRWPDWTATFGTRCR